MSFYNWFIYIIDVSCMLIIIIVYDWMVFSVDLLLYVDL